MIRLDHMGRFEPSDPCSLLESSDVFFDNVKLWALGFHLRRRNVMGPFSNLYIQGSECKAFYFAAKVNLREKQRVGFALVIRITRR